MREETQHHGRSFEETHLEMGIGDNQERQQSAGRTRGNAVPHAAMHGVAFENLNDTEPNQAIHDGSHQHHRLMAASKRFEPRQHQHRNDRGGERRHFAHGCAAIAVEIGQHAADAAQTKAEQARFDRHVEIEMAGRAIHNAQPRAERDVRFEIRHDWFLPNVAFRRAIDDFASNLRTPPYPCLPRANFTRNAGKFQDQFSFAQFRLVFIVLAAVRYTPRSNQKQIEVQGCKATTL